MWPFSLSLFKKKLFYCSRCHTYFRDQYGYRKLTEISDAKVVEEITCQCCVAAKQFFEEE